MLLPQTISPSWNDFLTDEIMEMLDQIEVSIGDDYTPSKDKIMRFLTTDLSKMKVCIVGQDVYFQPGIATGRSFEVYGLKDWNDKFPQVSLKNFVRLIHKSYHKITDYSDILKYKEILEEVNQHRFPLLPPNKQFDSLEDQGVLFLNTYLTCKVNQAKSHRLIWEAFSMKLFDYISLHKPELHWFLWGNEAKMQRVNIAQGVIYECRHPMMCSETYHDYFLKSNCIQDTMDKINWLGIE